MADNAHEAGCLNLPFVGHCTFAKSPPYGPAGVTSILAAQLILNTLGSTFHARHAGLER